MGVDFVRITFDFLLKTLKPTFKWKNFLMHFR